jgi:DNA polymerase I-like protein with 3'-5' exonuclease and polymerase domains
VTTLYIIFDLEADALIEPGVRVPTKIHVLSYNLVAESMISQIDVTAATIVSFPKKPNFFWDGAPTSIAPYDRIVYVGHNILAYDLRVLQELWGMEFDDNFIANHVIDTLLLSKRMWPSRDKFGLKDFGKEFGIGKPEVEDWQNASYDVYKERCEEDVKITMALFQALMQEAQKQKQICPDVNWRNEIWMDNLFRWWANEIEETGVAFNYQQSGNLYASWSAEMQRLAKVAEPHMPMIDLPPSQIKHPPKKQFLKDGTPSAASFKYFPNLQPSTVPHVWTFTHPTLGWKSLPWDEPLVTQKKLELGSLDHLKTWLMEEHGWVPTYWNNKRDLNGRLVNTSPKFTNQGNLCPDLERLADEGNVVAQNVAEWLVLRHRRSLIANHEKRTGYLYQDRVDLSNVMTSEMDTVGTVTNRVKHRKLANVPRASSKYGKELRELFGPGQGYIQLGADQGSLENRLTAHAVFPWDGGGFANKVLAPGYDAHAELRDALYFNFGITLDSDPGIARSKAKTANYALVFGAKPKKIANTLRIDGGTAQAVYNAYWKVNWAVKEFDYYLEKQLHQYGFILGILGDPLFPDKPHAKVNTWIQNAGAVVAKLWSIMCWQELKERNLDSFVHPMIFYHDEFQLKISSSLDSKTLDEIRSVVKTTGESIAKVLELKVPLVVESKLGSNWAECH